MKNLIILICLALCCGTTLSAQELKVVQSRDEHKVNIDVRNGVSTIAFETNVKNLVIDDDYGDECIRTKDGTIFFLIQPRTPNDVKEYGHPKRTFLLKTSATPEYQLCIPEILPNTVTYYTVLIPNQFPLSMTAEYIFTSSSKHGFRISLGNQFGGYVSYKWGDYKASGNNLNDFHADADLTNAEYLGYIRKSLTAGARFGVLHKYINHRNCGLYLLVGVGYGEYGRQWKNPLQIEGNRYFYSDYMKGFEGEISLQALVLDWLSLSAGMDMLISNGKVSVDYMLGIGFNFNYSILKKKK